jgi:hypothetical protein
MKTKKGEQPRIIKKNMETNSSRQNSIPDRDNEDLGKMKIGKAHSLDGGQPNLSSKQKSI